MRWIIAFHIIFMVAWFAGLFYLPRLFVYHVQAQDAVSDERFKIMEKRLYYAIMTPAAVLTVFFGLWLLFSNFPYYMQAGWMHAKLACVIILILYHLYCGRLVLDFKHNRNNLSRNFFRWFNEIPTLLLIAIVILVVVQPI